MVSEEQYPLGYDPSWLRVRMHGEVKMGLLLDLPEEHAMALNRFDLLGPIAVHVDNTLERDVVVVERRSS